MNRIIRILVVVISISTGALAQTVTISGSIRYSGAAAGTVFVEAVTNLENSALICEWSAAVDGPFTNSYELSGMAANTYYVVAVIETNDLSSVEDPWGHYLSWSNAPVAVDTDPGDVIANVDFELIDGSVSNNPYAGGGDGDSGGSARIFDGSVYDGLQPSQGWIWDDGRRVTDEYFFDTSVVRLTNGNYRLYGNSSDQILGLELISSFDSYISSDGVNFTKESGHRFQEEGCFMPWVIRLSNDIYRCYYTDQSQRPNGGEGGRSVKSAISTNDGVDFVTEGDCMVCDTNLPNEFCGVRGARVLKLNDGTYRMYYHGNSADNVLRVLSATSPDGLSWTRDAGVRLDPADYSPYAEWIRNFAPCIPFGGDTVHLYVTMMRTDEGVSKAGIFDSTSSDGLAFNVATDPILRNYYIADSYTGDPVDPQVMAQDPTVILTTNGMRLYFGVYNGGEVLVSTSGIYSVVLPDWDDDGSEDWKEYTAGTDPNDSCSCFKINACTPVDSVGGGCVVQWSSVTGKTYCIDRSTNLLNGFDCCIATNLAACPAINIYTDSTATASGACFYRVRLE